MSKDFKNIDFESVVGPQVYSFTKCGFVCGLANVDKHRITFW